MLTPSRAVSCIIVAYKPDMVRLAQQIDSLRKSFRVTVVSNADTDLGKADLVELGRQYPDISTFQLGGNFGIGKAQNLGIHYAISQGFSYVLLLDDDSVMSTESIVALAEGFEALQAQGMAVGAACAEVFDRETGKPIVYKVGPDRKYVLIRDLMSSGTLVPLSSFAAVGLMNEELFIDCVDYEWGWRLQSHGLQCAVISGARLYHKLGQNTSNFLGYELKLPSPIRHYYQFRNVILLSDNPFVPWQWKVRNLLVLPLKYLAYAIFGGAPVVRLGFMTRGIIDGIRRKSGKYE